MSRRLQLRRRRRGAYFVELSLTLIPMLAILFAIVDYSMPVFFRSLLAHATREGSRYAITYQTAGGGATQTESIQNVVMAQSAGFLHGTAGREKIKVRFYNQTTFAEATGSNRNAPGNIVEVSVEGFEWKHMVPLLRMNSPSTAVYASSADRLETLPPSQAPPAP